MSRCWGVLDVTRRRWKNTKKSKKINCPLLVTLCPCLSLDFLSFSSTFLLLFFPTPTLQRLAVVRGSLTESHYQVCKNRTVQQQQRQLTCQQRYYGQTILERRESDDEECVRNKNRREPIGNGERPFAYYYSTYILFYPHCQRVCECVCRFGDDS